MLDIEASGFGASGYPIEIGFAQGDGRRGCRLIRPEPGWTHWDDRAEQVHGISRLTLERHGHAAPRVAGWLNDQLAGQTVYCDGWAHDYPWLARLFDAAGTRPAFRLEHLRSVLDEAGAARWDATLGAVRRRSRAQRHRASADARAIQTALLELQRVA